MNSSTERKRQLSPNGEKEEGLAADDNVSWTLREDTERVKGTLPGHGPFGGKLSWGGEVLWPEHKALWGPQSAGRGRRR